MENRTGQFISERRKAIGLTQKELAERLGVTNKAVSKWETGGGMPDVSMLRKLSEILEVSVDELLAGYDHHNLSELPEFATENPTSEILARHIFSHLETPLANFGARLYRRLVAQGPCLPSSSTAAAR